MKKVVIIIIVYLLMVGWPRDGVGGSLPIVDGNKAVATVNGEPITVEELESAIAAAHASRAKTEKAGQIDYSAIINRLINTRLIAIEARNMGLDELVEIREMVDSYSRDTLRILLLEGEVKDVKADESEVERLYKESVKEWKITSVRFDEKDSAKQLEAALNSGKDFDEEVTKALEQGLAKEVDRGNYLKDRELTGSIARLVSKMEVGSTSPVVSLGKRGFIIFRLEGMRIPDEENQQARKEAKRQALNQKKVETARAYYQELKEKYVTIDEDLLATLDYEAPEPGFDTLLQDKRVIAEIKGEKPITVGDLGEALKKKFYHGVERAIEKKKVNKRKKEILESMIEKKILLQEALKQNIDKTEEYIDRVEKYELSLIFGTFVNKVIIPDITLDMKELKTYYEDNRQDYTLPQMVRIKSIVFSEKSKATNALDKLRHGTDFNWLSSRAEGQVDRRGERVLPSEDKLLTVRSLPEDLHQALSEVKPGDFRLYESPEGRYYVLYVYHVVPAELQPFEKVKGEISKALFDDKVKKALEDYAEKLKEYYPVEIYAKDPQ
jgi:hypothetical protein